MTERDGPGIRRHVVSGNAYERLSAEAQEAVQDRLIERYSFFINQERALRDEGRSTEADGAHYYATIVIRAYAAESRL